MKSLIATVCIFFFFFFFFFSFACMAMNQSPFEEYKNDYAQRTKMFQKVNLKIQSIQEEEVSSYYGKTLSSYKINEIKALFSWCNHTVTETLKLLNLNYETITDLSATLFKPYCQTIYLTKSLHEVKNLCSKGSNAENDAITALNSFSIFEDYLLDDDKYLTQFLKIERQGKIKGIKNYRVEINIYDILYTQKRQLMNQMNVLKLIDFQKLQLPEKFENLFKNELENSKKLTNSFLQSKVPFKFELIMNKKNYQCDLAAVPNGQDSFINQMDFSSVFEIRDLINKNSELMFNGLYMRFSEENGENCTLSDEEREKNLLLYQQLFEDRLNLASQEIKKEQSAKKSIEKRKPTNPQKKQAARKPQKKVFSPQTKPQGPKNIIVSPVVEGNAYPQSVNSETQPSEICASSSSTSTASMTTTTSSTIIDEINTEGDTSGTSVTFVQEWLETIMETSKAKEDQYFSIYSKAYNSQRTLIKHPELLEEIQQVAQNLTLYLKKIEQNSISNNQFLFVPMKLEPDFDYFIYTPIRYLTGLRMGFITTLFEALGAMVDKGRNGSRVHFAFNEYKTSIHVHDKINGEVDSGAISSLRKFLLDVGWTSKEY